MAKKSMIERELKRKKLVAKYLTLRKQLTSKIKKNKLS